MWRRIHVVALLVSALLACQHRSQVDPRVNGEVVQLDRPPPALTGTVTVLADGVTSVVADPDRDRVLVVDLAGRTITRSTLHGHASALSSSALADLIAHLESL